MKKKMIPIQYGVLGAMFLCMALTGCNTGDTPSPPPPESTKTASDESNVLFDQDWTAYQGKGALSLAIAAGNHGAYAPRLIKSQPEGDWILHGHMTYLSAEADGDNHAGLTLYRDESNYLVWGPRNNGALVLSGKINGEDTGELARCEEPFAHLRIWKNADGPDSRYHVYGATDAYYSWSYIGCFTDIGHVFDQAKIGAMGLDYANDSSQGYCVQFEFLNDYKLYMYKDTFNDPALALDGHWLTGQEKASLKNGLLTLSGSSDTPSLLLRDPLPYAWTIETMLPHDTSKADAYAGVCVQGSGLLSVGIQGGAAQARLDGTVIGQLEGSFQFAKIIQNDEGYSLRVSSDGQSWQTVADCHESLGSDIRYGLISQDSDADFDWFCERPTPNGVIRDVASFQQIGLITGENSPNHTESNWGWGSGDLGSMFELDGAIYMAFGDTFAYANQRGDYYKNSLARISDPDSFQDGLLFDWIKLNPQNGGLVNSRDPQDPTSMIPTSSIGILQDGVPTMYLHFMEIRQWTSHGTHWTINGSGWASSTDEGDTWILHDRIFEGDTNFAQVACYQEDGYVYILGAGAGGEGPIKLCRVPEAQLAEGDSYEFFIGTDSQDVPLWSPREEDAIVVIDSVNKEFGLVYDEGLSCFLMTTLDNVNQQMVLRDAPHIWGPWSMPVLLFDESYVEHEDVGQRFFYGSFMHPRFMEDDGRTVYMTLSKWVPYNIEWMKVNFEVEENGE